MWKQKDEEEVRKIRQRKKNAYMKIWLPFKIAVFLFLLSAVNIKIGYSKFPVPHLEPMTWRAFLEYGLMKAFWIALFFFVVSYMLQIISKNLVLFEPEAMICLKCWKLKNDDKNYKCDCGGEFVPLDELDWVDEENEWNHH